LYPLWAVADEVNQRNVGLAETNLLSLSYGKVIRKDINEVGGLRPGSYESYNIIQAGDTVLRMTDLQNDQRSIRSGYTSETGIITSAYITLRPRLERIEPRYLSSAMRAYDVAKVYYDMGGGVRQTLKFEELSQLPVPLPSLPEQRRIADYLDRETAEIDTMDAELDRLVEKLRERRAAAVETAIGRAFREAPLAPIWSLLAPVKDQDHPGEQVLSVYREYGVIPKDSRDDNANRTPENLTTYQLVRPGDLVVNKMKAWQGSLGVSVHRGIVSPDYQVCRPVGAGVDPAYLHAVLRSPQMIPLYRVRSKGVRPSQWRLYWEDMAPLMIPVLDIESQRRIVAELDEQTARIDDIIADAQHLKALLAERRSTLITEVVTGRKEVPA